MTNSSVLVTLVTIGTAFVSLLPQGTQSSRVLELSDQFLDIRHEGMWLIEFYAPWCGHCKKLEPIYAHVAQQMVREPVRVGKVDATRFPAVGKEFGIEGYPTIIFIKGNVHHTYNGDRTTKDIVAYAKRMMAEAVIPLPPAEGNKRPELYAVFNGNLESELFQEFHLTGEKFQDKLHFFFDQEKGRDQELTGIAMVLGKGPEEKIVYDGEYPMDVFIKREMFPKLTRMTNGNYGDLMRSGRLLVVGVVEEDKLGRIGDPVEQKFVEDYEAFVEKHWGTYRKTTLFVLCTTPSLANSLTMTNLQLPNLFALNTSISYLTPFPWDLLDLTSNLSWDLSHHIPQFLLNITEGFIPSIDGNSWKTKTYRVYFEMSSNLVTMFKGNPVLTTLLFGLPLGFLSLICYSGVVVWSEEESEEERERLLREEGDLEDEDSDHEKRE